MRRPSGRRPVAGAEQDCPTPATGET
jgi:hypothetical protein